MNFEFIGVSGYGWTGSSAVVDLLKECRGVGAPEFEFSLLREPYGIIDLELHLVESWDFLRHDIAIKDFLWFCNVLNRSQSKIGVWGGNLGRKLNTDFLGHVENYIRALTDMDYLGDSTIFEYSLNRLEFIQKKIKRKFNIGNYKLPVRLARPTCDKFITETRMLICKLFESYASNNSLKHVVLDQAIPVTNLRRSVRYFNNIKLIIVDRDPRDIFVDLIGNKALIGPDLEVNDNAASMYIKWHRILREECNSVDDSNIPLEILKIDFEDLVLNYDACVDRIFKFLGGNIEHQDKGKYFNPVVSKKNIGLWQSYHNQSCMEEIICNLRG